MISLHTFRSPVRPCSYLPDELASLTYDIVGALRAEEYMILMVEGWRRFGFALFRPECPACQKCLSLRIPVDSFKPDRSQQRAWKKNVGHTRLEIGSPTTTPQKLALYDRFHMYRTATRDWPEHEPETSAAYETSFVKHPFPTEEWCYYIGDTLVGVGYVDALSGGLSAIYFYYDPAYRDYSLGTYNVLKIIDESRVRRLPQVYLGYYVEGCQSLEYKSKFQPNEVYTARDGWHLYLS